MARVFDARESVLNRGEAIESVFCHELRLTLTGSKGEQALVRREELERFALLEAHGKS